MKKYATLLLHDPITSQLSFLLFFFHLIHLKWFFATDIYASRWIMTEKKTKIEKISCHGNLQWERKNFHLMPFDFWFVIFLILQLFLANNPWTESKNYWQLQKQRYIFLQLCQSMFFIHFFCNSIKKFYALWTVETQEGK
jgi:hypothetical protein